MSEDCDVHFVPGEKRTIRVTHWPELKFDELERMLASDLDQALATIDLWDNEMYRMIRDAVQARENVQQDTATLCHRFTHGARERTSRLSHLMVRLKEE